MENIKVGDYVRLPAGQPTYPLHAPRVLAVEYRPEAVCIVEVHDGIPGDDGLREFPAGQLVRIQ